VTPQNVRLWDGGGQRLRQPDSLVRMLLCVDTVQMQVANLLLQKLSEFTLDAE